MWNHLKKNIALPLVLSIGAYAALWIVRVQQSIIVSGESGSFADSLYALGGKGAQWDLDYLRVLSYVLFVLVVIGYFWAMYSVRYIRPNLRNVRSLYLRCVIVPFIFFSVISLSLYPHSSRPTDTVDYAMYVRVQVWHGENPYLVPGSKFAVEESLPSHMEAKNRPSVYGPLWQFLSIPPALAGGGEILPSIISFKIFFAVVLGLCLFLVWVFHNSTGIVPEQVLLSGILVGWNPIMYVISQGEGHNDIVMAVFVLASAVALATRHNITAFAAWSASVLVKFVSLPIYFPLLVYVWTRAETSSSSRWRTVVFGTAVAAVCALVLLVPFGAPALFANVAGRYGNLAVAEGDSKISVLAVYLAQTFALLGMPVSTDTLTGIISVLLPLGWLGFVLLRSLGVRTLQHVVQVGIESFLVYVTFVALPVYAQYAVTPVILAGALCSGKWHRIAVVVVSLALTLDSLLLVYMPRDVGRVEILMHQLTHFVLVPIFAVFAFWKLTEFFKYCNRPI